MALDPYGDRWYRDFTVRILPVEWKVAKQSKQKGFVEPLGVAALCFTEVATGETFKLFEFTLVSYTKKEINVSGISDSGIQITVSIFARSQNYSQLLVLLECLQSRDSDAYSAERIPPATLATDSTPSKFLSHYLTKAAAALDTRPSCGIPEIERDRFLAVMRLIIRRCSATSNKPPDTAIEADAEAGDVMLLPSRIEAHRRLLVEMGICNDLSNSEMSHMQKLQVGLPDVDREEILLELGKAYKPAYLLPKTTKTSHRDERYTQQLEEVIRNAESLCNEIDNQDNSNGTACEVVRSNARPCGMINLSDMSAVHSARDRDHDPVGDRAALGSNHVPGSAKFIRRPVISTFNATVEEIPDLTTPL
ncbi:hypothetical protein GL50803_0014762 [Giardia duodenalis]|uniref:Uncharacterized protein n=1 Tax=Giardia intestinalis (strain ATCC 50803 / WB clone C6) TaxID=184922 RepID=A0A644F4H9_GIAIC|nr:hypothetical protein GL50803_0014762 [Giardia intestinalis]KAE8303527.1 hypothetical protein GL50803_0014762 [Giardia intestinalis]